MATNNYALAPQPPTVFTYLGQQVASGPIIGGVLIGDYVDNTTTVPAGSNYNVPTVTLVSTVPVSAQLELQSTTGALLIMRMTTTQRNALVTVVNGMMIYNSTTATFQFYQGGSWLSLSAGAGGVTGPGSSTDNAVVRWDGTGGTTVQNSLVIVDDSGNLSAVNVTAGASGTAGIVSSFPSAATTGSLRLVAVANSGNTNTTISNASMGQASVVTIPDPGAATARFLVAAGATPFTSGNIIKSSGTGGLTVDAGFALKAATTAAYAGGGTSNTFTATGLTAASIVTAVILTSTNSVAITKAVPGTNTLAITFSADPGASTTVSWIGISAAV